MSRKLWTKKAYFIITFTESVGGGGIPQISSGEKFLFNPFNSCLPGNAFIDYMSEVSRKLWAKKAYFIITFTRSVRGWAFLKFPVVRNSILTPLTLIRLGGVAPSHVFRFWSATAKWLKQLSWNFETFHFTFELCAYFTLCMLSLEHP